MKTNTPFFKIMKILNFDKNLLILITANILFVKINTAQIHFQQHVEIQTGTSQGENFCIAGDFNNDSLNDLVIFSNHTTQCFFIYKQENSQIILVDSIDFSINWEGYTQCVSSGDLNNDGLLDLILNIEDTLAIYFQDSIDGFFNSTYCQKFATGNLIHGIAIGDINGDSLNDIAYSLWDSTTIGILSQTANNSFTLSTYFKPYSVNNEIIIKDINNDRYNDLLISNGMYSSGSNPNANLYTFLIYLQDTTNNVLNPPLHFELSQTNLLYNWTSDIGINDLNSDGLNDILTLNNDTMYFWYQNSSNPILFDAPSKAITTYINSATIDIADLNNDNTSDILLSHNGYDRVSFFVPDSNLNYQSFLLDTIYCDNHMESSKITVSDINNDTYLDIIVANSNGVSILFSDTSTISIAEYSGQKKPISIFPNPIVENQLNFKIGNNKDFKFRLFTIDGKLVFEKEYFSQSIFITQNLNLHEGIYLYQIEITNHDPQSGKLIILK